MSVKKIIKLLCPRTLWTFMHNKRIQISVNKQHKKYVAIRRRLKGKKEPLNVLFMAVDATSWKYDSLYLRMLDDPMFNPIILVCPQVNRGYEHMIEKLRGCVEFYKIKKYKYIVTYKEETKEYFEAQSLRPDIIFYTNPYKGLIDDRYYIDQFPNSLTCYVNYAFNNVRHPWACNLPLHQNVWKYFLECDLNYQQTKLYSPIRAKNCVIVGYPMYDAFVLGSSNGKDWKINDDKHKKIIWSPHHTIDGRDEMIKFSTFLLFYDIMVKMAKKYCEKIEIAFKPHPLLKVNLYEHPEWGKERTDKYYDFWLNGENTTLVEGEYVDLFKTSNAMINDSGSFTVEYLYVQKPCLFLSNYNRQIDANAIALKAFDCWYHATTEEQIDSFISKVVLAGEDTMLEKRKNFFSKYLLPPNGCSVAENIINEIKKELKI